MDENVNILHFNRLKLHINEKLVKPNEKKMLK